MTDELQSSEDMSEQSKIEPQDIVEAITKQNPRLFNGIDKKKKAEIVNAFSVGLMTIQKSHSGPLPDAETLAQYDKIIPNGAERIMQMAEKEQEYRHNYTKELVKRQLNQISIGQFMGFGIAILGIGGGIFLAYSGKETTGLSTIIGSLVILAGAFITGKVQENKSNSRTDKQK